MKKKKISDKEFANMEKMPNERDKYIQRGFYFYLSYSLRIFLMFLVIALVGVVTYFCFANSFSDSKNIILNYQEKDDFLYTVKLLDKENNPFGDGLLKPGEYYISDIIDDINTNLIYNYEFDQKVDTKYSYYVDVTMILNDTNTGDIISQNDYNLINKIEKEEKNTQSINLNQSINLDYDYYQKLATDVVSINNKINATGKLILKMYINTETKYAKFEDSIKNDHVIEVTIPLLSSQVKIEKTSNLNNKDSYVKHVKAELKNELLLYTAIVLLILDTLLLLLTINFIIKTLPKKSTYTRLKERILNNYNKIIVNSKKIPDLAGYNVIDCDSFRELLDAQSLLNKPIIYYEIIKNQKAVFVILGGTDAYKFVLKECDIEEDIS